jgi:hypothetical protein
VNFENRVKRIETSLTPKDAVVLWLRERHLVGVEKTLMNEVINSLAPRAEMAKQVGDALRQNLMRGRPLDELQRIVLEGQRQADVLVVLALELEQAVRSETRILLPHCDCLFEKLRSMIRDGCDGDELRIDCWTSWSAQVTAASIRLRRLQEIVAGISVKHYQGTPLLFEEDQDKLKLAIDLLQHLARVHDDLELPGCKPINIDTISLEESVISGIETHEICAKAISLKDFGEETKAWELVSAHARRAICELREADPSASLYRFVTS